MQGGHRGWGAGRDRLDDFCLPFHRGPSGHTVTASRAEALTPASGSATRYRRPHTSNGAGLLPGSLMFQATHIPGALPVLLQPRLGPATNCHTPEREPRDLSSCPRVFPGDSSTSSHRLWLQTTHSLTCSLTLRIILNLGTVLSDPKGTPQCLGQKNRMPCDCWRRNHAPSAGHDPPSLFPDQDSYS